MPVSALRAHPVLLRAVVSSLVARLPLVMLALGMVLLVRDTGHPYWAVGIVSGAFVLGTGLAAPLLGRASDRLGAVPVLAVSTVVEVSALLVLAAIPDRLGVAGLALVAALAGSAEPPVNAVVRALMPRLVEGEVLRGVYTLEAALQEVLFVVGPPAVALIATLANPRVGVAVCAAMVGVAVAWFIGEVRGHIAPPRVRTGPSAISSVDLRLLSMAFALMGVTFAAIDIATVAGLDHHGSRNLAGLALGGWALGSLISGFVAARRAHGSPWRRLPRLLLVMTLLTAPLMLLQRDPLLLGAGLFVQGMAIAPCLGTVYELVPRIAPEDALTEAFAWTSSFIMVGVSVGAAITGALAEWAGPAAGFALAAVTPLLGMACARVLARRRELVPA